VLLVDTNVLIDVLEDDPTWADWSVRQLRAQAQVHELLINPVIYSELSLTFESVESLDKVIDDMGFSFQELPRTALFLAGRAFVKYRRGGRQRESVLADFFIGAHAAVVGCGILTRDARRYRNYFPTVSLVTPEPTAPGSRKN
jgi:predicted nucleic acid-binding protein